MNTHPPVGKAQRAGAACGHAWQGWLRQEKRLIVWGVTQGVPAALTQTLLWVVKLLLIGALFYLAFWVVLLVLFASIALLAAKNQNGEDVRELSEDEDHRKSVFYDPINYNDDPDPRFEDE